jgi:hypothetical protein
LKEVAATLSSRTTLAHRLCALHTQCTRLYLWATALAPHLRRSELASEKQVSGALHL